MVKILMTHLIYQGILYIKLPLAKKKISKEKYLYKYKKVFFPAIQMSSLLETAGQR